MPRIANSPKNRRIRTNRAAAERRHGAALVRDTRTVRKTTNHRARPEPAIGKNRTTDFTDATDRSRGSGLVIRAIGEIRGLFFAAPERIMT
jgi:hypothetical protein